MQKCKIENCNNSICSKSTGLCHKHHLRFIRFGTTELTKNTVKKCEHCIVDGCDNYQQTRCGYCLTHYKRFKRAGGTDLLDRTPKKCKYCDRVAVGRGMCSRHYQNWKRHGDAEYTDKIRQGTNKHGYRKSQGDYRVQHREVAAKLLGRKLSSKELVHHIDLDKLNNNKENLYVCNVVEHSSIHQQLNRVAGELVKLGIIKFKDGKYYIDIKDSKI